MSKTERVARDDGLYEFVGREEEVPYPEITAVTVIPWTRDRRLVAVMLERGLDFPGGHLEVEDLSVQAAARREAWEEAAIRLGTFALVGHLRSPRGYIAIVTADVIEVLPFAPTQESRERRIVTEQAFLDSYVERHRPLMSLLLSRARAVYCCEQRLKYQYE